MFEEIKKFVISRRKKKMRVRTIFLLMRETVKYEAWSDMSILNVVIEALINLQLPYSQDEVRSVFKMVNKSDYEPEQKRMLLKGLFNDAGNKSIF